MRTFTREEGFAKAVGQDLGTSGWLPITQSRIDAFAEATEDRLWIHTDPARAAAGPFGTTIAHGFLVLGLVAPVITQVIEVRGFSTILNYGLDRVRFPRATPTGCNVRGQVTLVSVAEVTGSMRVTYRVSMQADVGDPKPVCVADLVTAYLV
jgi:acyl dehydratase